MLDAFKKIQEEKEKRAEENHENIILPDSADLNATAEDGKPLTPQIQEIMEMREELADKKPTNTELKIRDKDLPADQSRTINSNLRDIPKLCDQCYLIDKCPHYQEGADCYFRNKINLNTDGKKGIVDIMTMLLETQGERVLFGRMIEQAEGGYLDGNLSKEMKLLMDMMKDFKEVLAPPKEEIVIKASGPAGGTGGNGGGGGILSQLFGGGGQ